MGLTGGANLTALRTATHDASAAIRLGALLALRRLGRPEVTEVLQDSEPALVREAAIAINDVPIAEGYVALAALLVPCVVGWLAWPDAPRQDGVSA